MNEAHAFKTQSNGIHSQEVCQSAKAYVTHGCRAIASCLVATALRGLWFCVWSMDRHVAPNMHAIIRACLRAFLQGYTKLLKVLGGDIVELLDNLNNLHVHLSMSQRHWQAPSFRCEKVSRCCYGETGERLGSWHGQGGQPEQPACTPLHVAAPLGGALILL